MARNRRGNFSRSAGTFANGRQATIETIQQLRELGESVYEAAKQALAEGAEEVVQSAKQRCHVFSGYHKDVESGALRDSIKAVKQRGGTAYMIEANAKNKDGIPYGQFVEFSPKINKPFLYPAMDENRNKIYRDILDSIKQAIRRAG